MCFSLLVFALFFLLFVVLFVVLFVGFQSMLSRRWRQQGLPPSVSVAKTQYALWLRRKSRYVPKRYLGVLYCFVVCGICEFLCFQYRFLRTWWNIFVIGCAGQIAGSIKCEPSLCYHKIHWPSCHWHDWWVKFIVSKFWRCSCSLKLGHNLEAAFYTVAYLLFVCNPCSGCKVIGITCTKWGSWVQVQTRVWDPRRLPCKEVRY